MVEVRKAEIGDMASIMKLLGEVLEVHAKLRPDLFKSGTTKYTEEALLKIIENSQTPVFVAEMPDKRIAGYAFCCIEAHPESSNMRAIKTLYIDDICVDASIRHQHVATTLFTFLKSYAQSIGCYDMTLNVWEGNDIARAFYEKMGMFVRKTQMEILI